MAGSFDHHRVHVEVVPASFQFMVIMFVRDGSVPMAVLRRNAVCGLSDSDVAALLRGCASELDAGTVTRKDTA